jgi:hypothetical protein
MLRGALWFAAVVALVFWVFAAQSAPIYQLRSSQIFSESPSIRTPARAKLKRDVHVDPHVIPPLPVRKPPTDLPAAKSEPDAWPASEIQAAQAHCAEVLKTIDAVTVPEPPIKQGKCGAPAPIRLVSLGKDHRVVFDPPALTNCDMAAALSQWLDKDVQPFALKHLKSRVAKLEIMSDYSCRASSGRVHNRLSEHAFADALDIGSFVTESGHTVEVLRRWGETRRDAIAKAEAATKAKAEAEQAAAAATAAAVAKDAPAAAASVATAKAASVQAPAGRKTAHGATTVASRLGGPRRDRDKAPDKTASADMPPAPAPTTDDSRFLHDAHTAACQIFGTTLGPEANEDHRNHFHVDMAERKYKKICD